MMKIVRGTAFPTHRPSRPLPPTWSFLNEYLVRKTPRLLPYSVSALLILEFIKLLDDVLNIFLALVLPNP